MLRVIRGHFFKKRAELAGRVPLARDRFGLFLRQNRLKQNVVPIGVGGRLCDAVVGREEHALEPPHRLPGLQELVRPRVMQREAHPRRGLLHLVFVGLRDLVRFEVAFGLEAGGQRLADSLPPLLRLFWDRFAGKDLGDLGVEHTILRPQPRLAGRDNPLVRRVEQRVARRLHLPVRLRRDPAEREDLLLGGGMLGQPFGGLEGGLGRQVQVPAIDARALHGLDAVVDGHLGLELRLLGRVERELPEQIVCRHGGHGRLELRDADDEAAGL
mmetsp:Transcript_21455/g.52815  ORF Transcript_21455/g.52815 Transcript_21455/m.52815 type:complete len:271 (+) Transcript_21455:673-1485(+)